MAFLRLFEDTKTYQNSQPSAQGSFRGITLKLGKFTNVKVFFEWFQRIILDIMIIIIITIIIIIIITIIRDRYYVQLRNAQKKTEPPAGIELRTFQMAIGRPNH